MQVTNTSVAEGRGLIPIKGWDGVASAITLYANGHTNGALDAQQITEDDMRKSHGERGGDLFVIGSLNAGDRSEFVDELLKKAENDLARWHEFKADHDYYGAPGPFHKTTVHIKRLDKDVYGLGINAAVVGDKPEVGLATSLGVTRALHNCRIEIEVKAVGVNRFEFDFEPVVRKLSQVLDIKSVTGAQVAQGMLQDDDKWGKPLAFVIGEKDGLEVEIRPGNIERRWSYGRDTKRDTWSVNGSVFSGELCRDYGSKDPNAKAQPTFFLFVQSAEKRDFGQWKETLPMWRPEQQTKAIALANQIAGALK